MQNKRYRLQPIKRHFDRIKMFRAFGQDQHFASLSECITHLFGDGFRSGFVVCEMPEHVLDASIARQVDPRKS